MKNRVYDRLVQGRDSSRLKTLPNAAGVYVLLDLDGTPLYMGHATGRKGDSIRKRVQRHLTSARSDVIANRQLDVWEVAYVRGWAVPEAATRSVLEAQLFHLFDGEQSLVNGTVPPVPAVRLAEVPEFVQVQTLPDAAIEARRDPAIRFPRQVQQFHQLLDYILNTQDKRHLRRALSVHYRRMSRHLDQFLRTHGSAGDDDADDS